MAQPQLTGYDYMLVSADMRAKNGEAYTQEFREMLEDYVHEPADRKGTPGEAVVMRSLRPEEEAAVAVAASAVGVAYERGDEESMREILFWGLGLVVKFNEWLVTTGRLKN